MKYTQRSFSVAVGSDEYRAGWDRIFGPRVRVVTVGEPLVCHCSDCACEEEGPGDGPCSECAKGWHACSCDCGCFRRIIGGGRHARCSDCESDKHRVWEGDGVVD